MNELTIVYYTANKENEEFEARIRQRIGNMADELNIPIISVSQKPIDFGKNICVGDVGVSNQNCFRQLQLGCQEAKTPFVITAEADFLYPYDYFEFKPTEQKCYRFTNIWILYRDSTAGFVQKAYSEGASVYPREFMIKHIDRRLRGRGLWNNQLERDKTVPKLFYNPQSDLTFVKLANPAISIKTKEGMHKFTGLIKNQDRLGVNSLPYWGTAEGLRRELFI